MSLDMSSISSVGIFGALLLVGWVCLKMKTERMKKELPPDNDLVRFFAPGEELSGAQVLERIIERTGGTRNMWLSLIYDKLDGLVWRGSLCSRRKKVSGSYPYDDGDVVEYDNDGEIKTREVTVYSLPLENSSTS